MKKYQEKKLLKKQKRFTRKPYTPKSDADIKLQKLRAQQKVLNRPKRKPKFRIFKTYNPLKSIGLLFYKAIFLKKKKRL